MTKQADYSSERCEKTGRALMEIDALAQGWRSIELEFVGLSIRCPRSEGDEFLITVRALDKDGQPVVAFHSAFNMLELFIGLAGRLKNGTMRWKVDEWGR